MCGPRGAVNGACSYQSSQQGPRERVVWWEIRLPDLGRPGFESWLSFVLVL